MLRAADVSAIVESIEALAEDVILLRLAPTASERFRYQAGQYAELDLGDGVYRSFSIACAPRQDGRLEFHLRLAGDGLRDLVANLKIGAAVGIRGPYGQMTLRQSGRPLIMVAGGTGFAPIKALIEQIRELGVAADLHLYWGVRSVADLYLNNLIQQWQKELARFCYTPVLSSPKPADRWSGRTGWVHDAVLDDHSSLSAVDLYAAGPLPMVSALRVASLAKGLSANNFFSDFAALD